MNQMRERNSLGKLEGAEEVYYHFYLSYPPSHSVVIVQFEDKSVQKVMKIEEERDAFFYTERQDQIRLA